MPTLTTIKEGDLEPILYRVLDDDSDKYISVVYDNIDINIPSQKTKQDHMRQLSKCPHTINNTTGICRTNFKLQNSSRVNQSATNQKEMLINFTPIDPYPNNSIMEDTLAVYCTGKGHMSLKADNGETILLQCYYSSNVTETIMPKNNIVKQSIHRFNVWKLKGNHNTEYEVFE